MTMRLKTVVALWLIAGCSLLSIGKSADTIKIYVVPFDNFYYAGVRMSNIRNHPDTQISTVQNKSFYDALNKFIGHIDTCKIDTSLTGSYDFVRVLVEFKSNNDEKLVELGIDHVGNFVYKGTVYFPNEKLTQLIQPHIKEQFRKRHYPKR